MPNLAEAHLIALPSHTDSRGSLTALEARDDVPFAIKRIFFVHEVTPPYERGGHAHPDTEQLLVCVAGTMKVELSDGVDTVTFDLKGVTRGLYVPAMIWCRLFAFSPDAVCMAAASTHYDNAKVIREWESYRRLAVAES